MTKPNKIFYINVFSKNKIFILFTNDERIIKTYKIITQKII